MYRRIAAFVRKRGLEDRVHLVGERTDIPEILAASDIFVLPSRWEGLPLTIIEAMMAGLPVVASQVGGVPELVEEGKSGFLVEPRNPHRLAEALSPLLDDPELRFRLGQAGRQRALAHFPLDRMLNTYRTLYTELLAADYDRSAFSEPSEAKPSLP